MSEDTAAGIASEVGSVIDNVPTKPEEHARQAEQSTQDTPNPVIVPPLGRQK